MPSFTNFPDLPRELRLQIWSHALLFPRLRTLECPRDGPYQEIVVDRSTNPTLPEYWEIETHDYLTTGFAEFFERRSTAPQYPLALHHTNREARALALELDEWCLTTTVPPHALASWIPAHSSRVVVEDTDTTARFTPVERVYAEELSRKGFRFRPQCDTIYLVSAGSRVIHTGDMKYWRTDQVGETLEDSLPDELKTDGIMTLAVGLNAFKVVVNQQIFEPERWLALKELIVVLEDDRSELCDKINTSDAWQETRRRDLLPHEDLLHAVKLLVVGMINSAIAKHLVAESLEKTMDPESDDEAICKFSGNLPIYKVMSNSMLVDYGNGLGNTKPLMELRSKPGVVKPFMVGG